MPRNRRLYLKRCRCFSFSKFHFLYSRIAYNIIMKTNKIKVCVTIWNLH